MLEQYDEEGGGMVPQMHPVESSAVEMVGYDPPTAALTVRFTGGATYV